MYREEFISSICINNFDQAFGTIESRQPFSILYSTNSCCQGLYAESFFILQISDSLILSFQSHSSLRSQNESFNFSLPGSLAF